MKMFSILVTFFMATSAFAADWKEQFFKTNGMTIRLSWQTAEFSEGPSGYTHAEGVVAKPLYIDVWTDANLKKVGDTGYYISDKVRLSLNNNCISRFFDNANDTLYTPDLIFDKHDIKGNHYYGLINDGVVINKSTYYETFRCKQYMAIVKEGKWYKNGDRDFEVNLY